MGLRAGDRAARRHVPGSCGLLCTTPGLVHQRGFTDEYGKQHEAGYHYSIPYWEVLNEVDFEHRMTPQTYTRLYDAIVTAMKKVEPELKFAGVSLAIPAQNPDFFEYFLNGKNHEPVVPRN